MQANFLHGNREALRLAMKRWSAWRTHKGTAMMNGRRESDNFVVSLKPSNMACDNKQAAEKVERRGLAKGNPSKRNGVWTQRQTNPVQ